MLLLKLLNCLDGLDVLLGLNVFNYKTNSVFLKSKPSLNIYIKSSLELAYILAYNLYNLCVGWTFINLLKKLFSTITDITSLIIEHCLKAHLTDFLKVVQWNFLRSMIVVFTCCCFDKHFVN